MDTDKDKANWLSAPRLIELSLRLLVGGYFIIPALLKLTAEPLLFAQSIANYRLIAAPWSNLLALGLPWLELFAGVAIVSRRLYTGSLVIAAGMLSMFVVAVGSAWFRGLDINCGCFGSSATKSNYGLHILLNLTLLACTGALAWMGSRQPLARG